MICITVITLAVLAYLIYMESRTGHKKGRISLKSIRWFENRDAGCVKPVSRGSHVVEE